jgi:hypothetical protein
MRAPESTELTSAHRDGRRASLSCHSIFGGIMLRLVAHADIFGRVHHEDKPY